MAKAQMEIMGLAIVIILVGLGMLFAVQWMLKKPGISPAEAVKESTLAANFLNTMLSTSTDCYDRSVRGLLQDCALTGGRLDCFGQPSCEYVKDIINQMKDGSLDKWQKDYYFSISGSVDVEAIKFGEACKGEYESKRHPVPVRPGFEIVLKLDICR